MTNVCNDVASPSLVDRRTAARGYRFEDVLVRVRLGSGALREPHDPAIALSDLPVFESSFRTKKLVRWAVRAYEMPCDINVGAARPAPG
jgi:hypothetical protein